MKLDTELKGSIVVGEAIVFSKTNHLWDSLRDTKQSTLLELQKKYKLQLTRY